jgi:hypothetical protein
MTERPNEGTENGPGIGSLLTVVGWIAVGAGALAGIMLAIDSVVTLPLSRRAAIGLGLALGGGIGGVARLFRTGGGTVPTDETMTVGVEPDGTADPKPMDLFDGHPDPVLYYTTEGHGPVVRAANASFGETFDVPVDRLEGTPLSEALLVAGEETVDAGAVTAGGLDRIVGCETTVGTERFRLRTIQNDRTGYLLYTPEY